MTGTIWQATSGGQMLGSASAVSRRELLQYAPPYPGVSVIEPAIVPPPPLLDADASDEELALRALGAYRGVAEARMKKRCYVLRSGPGRFLGLLASGAKKLAELEIPPIAWCGWSWDIWHVRNGGLPPVPFVFGARRVEQRQGWFRSEATAYLGGAARYTESHRRLLKRWEAMAHDVCRASTVEEVTVVVNRYFPGRTYDRMVNEARAEAAAEAAHLKEALGRGVWLW